jgi:hypothetical protein
MSQLASYISTPIGNIFPKEGSVIPINKSVAEIKDLGKRKGGFTKTVLIAGDKSANQIFGHYYDVNILSGQFNHKVKVPVQIIQDGQIVLSGFMRLLSVTRLSKGQNTMNQEVDYQVSVIDETSSLFNDIGDGFLKDLDMKYLSHRFSAQAVIDSQDHNVTNGYKYLYPIPVDVGSYQYYPLEHFKPAIYAKVYWDKIFEEAGYTYVWDELADPEYRFDDLLLPYTGSELKPTQEDTIMVTAVVNGSYGTNTFKNAKLYSPTFNFSGGATVGNTAQNIFPNTLPPTTVISDFSNSYNLNTANYTLPISQNPNEFTVRYTLRYRINVVNPNPTNLFLNRLGTSRFGGNSMLLRPYLDLQRNNSNSFSPLSPTAPSIPVETIGNGFVVGPNQTRFGPSRVITGTLPINATLLSPGQTFRFRAGVYNFMSNASSSMFFASSSNFLGINRVSARIEIEVFGFDVEYIPTVTTIGEGMMLNMNRVIPDRLKKKDFIKGIMTHYNLYGEIDPENPTVIRFKGRDAYYDSGQEYDWTKKLVTELPSSIKFTVEESGKRTIVKYTDGKDEVNVGYQNATGESYGQQGFVFTDDFAKGDTTLQVPWEPTPVVRNNFGMHVLAVNGFEPKTGPRLVYDGGKKTCQQYPILRFGNMTSSWFLGNTTNIRIATTYTYAGHFDDPVNPAWDFNFGPCAYYFYNDWNNFTSNNMFTIHHARTFLQLEEGKIMEAYFDLDANDIAKIKLNDRVWIHDSWWNILEIIDYNANKREPTKVKLITVDPYQFVKVPRKPRGWQLPTDAFTPAIPITELPIFIPIGPIKYPTGDTVFTPVRELYDNVRVTTTVIEGTGPVYVLGPDNIIREGAEYVQVIGSGNVIEGSNKIIIADNVYVPQDDTGNTIYLGESFILGETGVKDRRVKIIDGGEDIVLAYYKDNQQDVIDPGVDVVRPFGGVNRERMVYDNGEDDVRWSYYENVDPVVSIAEIPISEE